MKREHEILVQNLLDAGGDTAAAESFCALLENGTHAQQMKLLQQQRTILLECLHKSQRNLDCLDYLIYTLKKSS